MADREMMFSCPHCGEPFARTKEMSVDIHAGATYTCRECGGKVVFSAQKPEEYSASVTAVAALSSRDEEIRRKDEQIAELREVAEAGQKAVSTGMVSELARALGALKETT